MTASPQQHYTSGSRRLYYRQSGEGQDPPLVLIHGLSGSRRWWRYNLPALERRGRVYVVELVGYGSARRRQRALGVREAAALVAEWLDALGLEEVALIGHSMGGQIALRVAALAPSRVARLVLAAASGLLHRAWWRVAARLPQAMRRGKLHFVPTILADGARAGLPNLIRSSRDLLSDDVSDLLPQIRQPTLVIWGDGDVLLPPALGEAIAAGIRDARFVLLRGAGHVLMVDAPQDFNREVLAFLDQTDAGDALSASYSHFRRVGGLVRHARVYPGPQPARPLVIVPGLGCASWMYRRLARCLAAGREVWVYDHPGMGLSQGRLRDPLKIERLTDHLAAWLTARGLAGVPLLGHSLGGEVVIDLAARYPALPGCLIMCAPTGIPENPSVSAQIVRFLLNLPLERLALYPSALLSYLRTGPRAYWLARDQDEHETGPLIPLVRCPALVIDGTADRVIRAWTLEIMCDELPQARARTIRGGTHAIMDSRPQEVTGETLAFLRDVEGGHFSRDV